MFATRLRLLSILVFLFALLLIGKLYMVQIVSGQLYKDKAEHQYVSNGNLFDRGSIFFTTKDGTLVPAASIAEGFLLSMNPSVIQKTSSTTIEDIYNKLNTATPIDKGIFLAKVAKLDDSYEELAHHLSQDVYGQITELGLPGISLSRESWRVYPGGTLAAHAVGLIGYQGNDLAGRYGLERYYEPVLARSGDEAFVNFFAEIFSNIKKSVTPGESPEGDIVTTIEPSVESFLEGELDKVNKQYSSNFTGGIVINPKNGEIYAMALDPTFDPNNPQKQSNSSIFSNNFVEDRYEMGSIIKALTTAAGLDTGAIKASTTYNDPGCETLDKKTFCNYDAKSHGNNLSMQVVLNQSLNTGAAFMVSKMGNQVFANYLRHFGLGSTTNIDLPNEGDSLVSNLSSNRDLEYAEASFGQGIALTPITTVRALSALANGGYLITPHLVNEIKYKIGIPKAVSYSEGDRVIKGSTAEEISRMLTEVVDTSLKNGTVRLANYSIAAKTGTAQIADPVNGGYYSDRFLHSFFGYFPSYDAKFLIFLFTYYPKGVQYASETLTSTFIDTAKFLINYYNIPPDRATPPKSVNL